MSSVHPSVGTEEKGPSTPCLSELPKCLLGHREETKAASTIGWNVAKVTWIKAYQSLATHRKLYSLATLLGIDEDACIGKLFKLWWWCVDNAPQGDISDIGPETIAKVCNWHGGDPRALVGALVESHFVDETREGRRIIHNWEQYAGQLIAKRERDAEWQRHHRQHTDDVVTTKTRRRDDVGTTSGHRVEKSRVDKISPPYIPPLTDATSLDGNVAAANKPEFLKVLARAFPKFNALKRPGKERLLEISTAAEERGLDMKGQAEAFVSWWQGRGAGPSNVVSAWHKWLAKAREDPFSTPAPMGRGREAPAIDWAAAAAASNARNAKLTVLGKALRDKYGAVVPTTAERIEMAKSLHLGLEEDRL